MGKVVVKLPQEKKVRPITRLLLHILRHQVVVEEVVEGVRDQEAQEDPEEVRTLDQAMEEDVEILVVVVVDQQNRTRWEDWLGYRLSAILNIVGMAMEVLLGAIFEDGRKSLANIRTVKSLLSSGPWCHKNICGASRTANL